MSLNTDGFWCHFEYPKLVFHARLTLFSRLGDAESFVARKFAI